jgi:hypothetical protein
MTFPKRVRPWWRPFQQHRVQMVLSAHAHRWNRFWRKMADRTRSENGIRQFVNGTAGP